MYNISYKYKRFLFLLLKLVIVIGACYYIYQKLVNNQQLSFSKLLEQFSVAFSSNIWAIVLLFLFTDVNWLLEMFKWKTLVSVEKKITFFEAYEQSLASLTTAIITPNRVGEYGAKALYFKNGKRKKIVLLNLLGNISQLAVTVFFGIIGMVFFLTNFNIEIPYLTFQNLLITLFIFVILFLLIKKFKSSYITKVTLFLKKIPKSIYGKVIGFSFLRYVIFTHQFYFSLRMFGIETDYLVLLNLLFCMYFIASFIPSLTIFDWAIKGSVAVYLFSFIGLNELTIIAITTIMWILNFGFPALLGSIFVLNFKFEVKE